MPRRYHCHMSFVTPDLLKTLVAQSVVPRDGFHSLDHWTRVLANGRKLAPLTGANLTVVELFAVFHDSRRLNEGYDPEHGQRAADFAAAMRKDWFNITNQEMDLLYTACELHTSGQTESDVTIQTCWDADRLDLGRVGITPHPNRLCTDEAKTEEMLEWAHYRRWER